MRIGNQLAALQVWLGWRVAVWASATQSSDESFFEERTPSSFRNFRQLLLSVSTKFVKGTSFFAEGSNGFRSSKLQIPTPINREQASKKSQVPNLKNHLDEPLEFAAWDLEFSPLRT
jgi:hypothetical protein